MQGVSSSQQSAPVEMTRSHLGAYGVSSHPSLVKLSGPLPAPDSWVCTRNRERKQTYSLCDSTSVALQLQVTHDVRLPCRGVVARRSPVEGGKGQRRQGQRGAGRGGACLPLRAEAGDALELVGLDQAALEGARVRAEDLGQLGADAWQLALRGTAVVGDGEAREGGGGRRAGAPG